MFFRILLLTVVILAVAFAAMAIRMFFIKDGEFKKQCHNAGINGEKCICGNNGGQCKRKDLIATANQSIIKDEKPGVEKVSKISSSPDIIK